MKNFWKSLPKPILAMAPMEDVTDIAFREMFARYSKHRDSTSQHRSLASVFVTFTEFTPSDGLAFGDERAQEKLRAKLTYTEAQRPIVAQIYNSNPERLESAARLVQELGFDGVDINMGCPVNAVVKQISGAALIKHSDLAVELIRAVKRGAPNIPVSVKTRIGYSSANEMREWVSTLLRAEIDVLTVHFRTRNEFSKVPARWELARELVELRDEISPETILLGNGDVKSVEQARALADEYGLNGVMIGRALFGTPDFFNTEASFRCSEKGCKIAQLIEHLELFDELLLKPGYKGYHVMKKYFKAYVNGWDGAKELRIRLMETNTPKEALELLTREL